MSIGKVTALSMLHCSAILAHHVLQERLNIFGMLGCLLCVTGSMVIVLHAPEERPVFSVSEIWTLAARPGEPLFALVARTKPVLPVGQLCWIRKPPVKLIAACNSLYSLWLQLFWHTWPLL